MFAATAGAQAYPTKPITMIVPFGAGGGTDIIARAVSEDLAKALKQSIVVEPRPGANGAIGSAVVARAAPDGYTLLFTASSTYSLNPNLMKEPPYDQLKDLVPVRIDRPLAVDARRAGGQPRSRPSRTSSPAARPIRASSPFPFWQSSVLVTGETFGQHRRRADAQGALQGRRSKRRRTSSAAALPIMFTDTAGARPQVDAGKMRVLGLDHGEALELFPDVPTMREAGLDVVTDSMLAVFAPAGTPKPILERLNAEISKIIETSEPVRARAEATRPRSHRDDARRSPMPSSAPSCRAGPR